METVLFVETLSLRNFRNYEHLDIHFEPSGNLFLGGNAQGKTNLLEAIHCLCVARSARNADDDELIRHGSENLVLSGTGVGAGNRRVTVEIRSVRRRGRQLKINGVIRRKISDLLGLFYVVNLSPDDGDVVGGPPRHRRRFLNFCICQISASYWASLKEYQRVVQQRNMALRSRSGNRWPVFDADELEAWDQQLVEVGARIISKRGEFLEKLNPEVELFHQRISDGDELLSLKYKPAGELDEHGDIEEQFRIALERLRKEELKFGMTLVGPHRDEIVMTINGVDLKVFGSQGQHRTAAVALKLAAARFLEKEKGERPILLLDEVFAELDEDRTHLLFELLSDFGQIFIAAAKESDLANCGGNLRRMVISHGTVSPA